MADAGDRAELAHLMRAAYEAVSPLMEEGTSAICPSCMQVCCIDRHGTHEAEDVAFILELGEAVPPERALPEDRSPCRHLGGRGCGIERWRRPYRCTWYFCDKLLAEMPAAFGARRYRELVAALGRLRELRERYCASLTLQ